MGSTTTARQGVFRTGVSHAGWILIAVLASTGPSATAAEQLGCSHGRIVIQIVREPGSQQIEPVGARQDPAQPLQEAPRQSGSVREWRLIAPLIRALDPMALGASMRPALESALRARGCEIVDAREDLWTSGESLARFASLLTTAKWRGENYDYLQVRAVPAITADAAQLVLYARAVLLHDRGMGRIEPFDLEHRSAPLPGADPSARVAGLAADGAAKFLAWRTTALSEVVALALDPNAAPAGATVTDARWHRTGVVVRVAQGRAIARFEGRYLSAAAEPSWSPDLALPAEEATR